MWDDAHSVVTAEIAWPELHAAVAAAYRAGRIDARTLRAVVLDGRALFTRMRRVAVDDELGIRAGALAERHALRGFDAVHLASALTIPGAVMVTWDDALGRATAAEGHVALPG